MTQPMCPSCASANTRVIGRIPPSSTFAGREVTGTSPSRLVECRTCSLGFRYPQPSREQLAQWYESGAEAAWHAPQKTRLDWRIASSFIAESGSRSVLDVGCFDGAFLSSLPESIDRAGIEINAAAADAARARGVRIVGSDLHELGATEETFDCVVAFDVLEHVHDPRALLSALTTAVSVGGHVIVATGDMDARTWRFMGSRYLYCWFQEHIAFVSPRWVRQIASELGLKVVRVERYSPRPGSRRGWLTGAAKNAAYRVAPRLVDRFRPDASLHAADPAPPAWTAAQDHFAAVLRRES